MATFGTTYVRPKSSLGHLYGQQRLENQIAAQIKGASKGSGWALDSTLASTASTRASTLAQNALEISVQLTVRNLEKAVDFYERAFGFTVAQHSKSLILNNLKNSCVLAHEGQHFLLLTEDTNRAKATVLVQKQSMTGQTAVASVTTFSPTTITVLCRDVTTIYKNAIRAGACSIQSPFTMSNGTKTFLVSEFENYIWRFMDSKPALADQ